MIKSWAEIAAEMHESVDQANNKEKKLLSKTFWKRFRVKKRTQQVIERVGQKLNEQDLSVSVKSGALFGKENKDDWIILTIWPPNDPPIDTNYIPEPVPVPHPPSEWFDLMGTRIFESEREVEYYFVIPLLEKLGYEEDDIVVGCPVKMFKGVKKCNKAGGFCFIQGKRKRRKRRTLGN